MENIEVQKTELLPEYAVDIDGIKVSKETLERLGSDLRERFQLLKDSRERSDWERDIADAFDSYHLVPPKKDLPYEGAPNLRCILPRIGVDTSHANRMYAFFGQDNMAKVEPDYISKDFVTRADKGAKYLSYVLNYESDFHTVMDDADRKADLFGIAFVEPRFEKQEVWETVKVQETIDEPVVNPLTGEMTMEQRTSTKTQKKKKTLFEGIKLESLPVECIYVSPFVRDLEQAVAHDVVFKCVCKKMKEIKRLSKSSYYLPGQVKMIEDMVTKKHLEGMAESDLGQAKGAFDGFKFDSKINNEMIDLVEAHLWEDVDGDNVPENVSVVFEPMTGTIIRICLAKCRIVEIRPRPIDERFYGESIFKLSKPICEEWESIHNGRVVRNDWSNNTFFFYRAGGRFNPQELTLTPGHGYPMDNPNDVYFPQITGPGPSGYQEEGLLMNYFERITGLSENFQGVTSQRETTATESINSNQRAGIRMSTPIARVSTAVEKLLGHIWELNRDCAPAEKEYFLLGPDGTKLWDKMRREDYAPQLKFKLKISTIFDQQLLRDTWLLAFRTFRQDPMIMNHPAAAYDLFKNTLRGMGIALDIPKPPQANVLSPMEEHEQMEQGDSVEPQVGEDYDEHLKAHLAWTKTDKFKEWSPEAQQELLVHIDQTQILKQTIEASNLNKSGVFEPPQQMGNMPAMTLSRNPSDQMNKMRVGETSQSMMENNRNGGYGA